MNGQYTLPEVARMLNLTYHGLYRLHYDRHIPEPHKVGRTRIYTEADVLKIKEYLAARKSEGGE
jgi:predicted DNA-binding transcriptional regulator AlpA